MTCRVLARGGRRAGVELARLYADGIISAAPCLRLQRALDLEKTRLSNEQADPGLVA